MTAVPDGRSLPAARRRGARATAGVVVASLVAVGGVVLTSPAPAAPVPAGSRTWASTAPAITPALLPAKRPARSLRVVVTGLPSGVRARVRVTGPGTFRRTVKRTRLLKDLRPGKYRVTASSVAVPGGDAGADLSKRAVRITPSSRPKVRVRYADRPAPVDPTPDSGAVATAAPTLTALTPSFATTSGGTRVTLVGTNFDARSTVTFGDAPGVVTSRSDTTLRVVVPAHPEGRVDVTVDNATGRTATLPAAFVFVPPSEPGTWRSGASGTGAADGRLGSWRGTPVQIGGTWNDSYEAQTQQWTLQPGGEWGSWSGDIDVAVGAIYKGRGETWAKASGGAYDARWAKALRAIAAARSGKPGTVFIRFAHEFNGEWTPWSVSGAEAPRFVQAWRRFRSLQQQILPGAKLVMCPNIGSSRSLGLDWRTAFPGPDQVDVMSVDVYNDGVVARTAADFDARALMVDGYGAPLGIESHRLFAESVGLPMAVSEWSANGALVDAPEVVERFRQWVAYFAGDGPGRVLYEILFNVAGFEGGKYQLFPRTQQPGTARRYVDIF